MIETFRPGEAALLDEGLWGRVYDLGDGTVLKLARERCAGIGDGRAKIANEYAGLTLLSATAVRHIVPAPRGHGAIAPPSWLAHEGFALWLRSTKLPGTRLTAETIERMPTNQQDEIGAKIGAALARLHAAFDAAPSAPAETSPGESSYAAIAAAAREIGDPFYHGAIATLTRARDRIPVAVRSRLCHGDFNISNILFGPDQTVTGIVDFAEWGANFREKDISDIVNELPSLAEPLRRAYEADSGTRLDRTRLALGIAENALYSAVIGERSGDKESIGSARALFATQMTPT